MLPKNHALLSVISRPRDGHNGSRRSARRLFPVWLLLLCSIAAPLACADEPLWPAELTRISLLDIRPPMVKLQSSEHLRRTLTDEGSSEIAVSTAEQR